MASSAPGSASKWLAEKSLSTRIALDYLKPIGKVARIPFLPVSWPLKQAWNISYAGLSYGVNRAEWSTHVARESIKGLFQAGVSPWLMLAKSRLVTVKRFLWDVPIATASAALRTPIALAKSPFEMVAGVRDAIFGNDERGTGSIFGNVKEIYNSITELNPKNIFDSTRKAITDVLLPPITRPLSPILTPIGNVLNVGIGAELQTGTTMMQAVTETIPEGLKRVWNAPDVATGIMDDITEQRNLLKEVRRTNKEKEREFYQKQVDEARGKPQFDDEKGN